LNERSRSRTEISGSNSRVTDGPHFTGHGLERIGVGNDGRSLRLFLEFTGVYALIENSPRFDLPVTRTRESDLGGRYQMRAAALCR
jgi:hypothetical protein